MSNKIILQTVFSSRIGISHTHLHAYVYVVSPKIVLCVAFVSNVVHKMSLEISRDDQTEHARDVEFEWFNYVFRFFTYMFFNFVRIWIITSCWKKVNDIFSEKKQVNNRSTQYCRFEIGTDVTLVRELIR